MEIGDVLGTHTAQILPGAGHVHFYWIKNGWIFRVAGAVYAAVNLFNALVYKNQPVDWVGIAVAAGLIAIGELLKLTCKPNFKLDKKYTLTTG